MILTISNISIKRYKANGVFINLFNWMFSLKGLGLQIAFGIGQPSNAYVEVLNQAFNNPDMIEKAIQKHME